jgi:hypothetical protein
MSAPLARANELIHSRLRVNTTVNVSRPSTRLGGSIFHSEDGEGRHGP